MGLAGPITAKTQNLALVFMRAGADMHLSGLAESIAVFMNRLIHIEVIHTQATIGKQIEIRVRIPPDGFVGMRQYTCFDTPANILGRRVGKKTLRKLDIHRLADAVPRGRGTVHGLVQRW